MKGDNDADGRYDCLDKYLLDGLRYKELPALEGVVPTYNVATKSF